MRNSSRKLLVLAATVSMTAAACGSDSNDATTDETPVVTEAIEEEAPVVTDAMEEEAPVETDAMEEDAMEEEAPVETDAMEDAPEADAAAFAVDDGASTLRAGLTSLLQEHVYLTGIVVETAVDAGGDLEGEEVQAAIAALDENTVALADAVGSVAGPENGDAFLELWRQHIGFFVDYTLGEATGNEEMKTQALTDLEGYQQAAGAFFEEITGGAIVADTLVGGLEGHVETLTAAIDAMVADSPEQFALLGAAADHMKGAAMLLSTGIVEALPEMFPGETDSGPAETRTALTFQLQEHVYLAGIALEQAVDNGGDLENPVVAAAVAELDVNTVELSEIVGSVAGEENGAAFLELWRNHIGFFVDYTLGEATGNEEMKTQALSDLEGYQQAAGAFFEEITGGEIVAADLIAGLEVHVETLTLAIDDMVAGNTAAFTDLRKAGQHMPKAALLLATGIVAATS
ncbi:MAG: hypothetical protein WA964_00620 [Ilumatobacter sp.]|uniref:hypothetical protein n=1 Tax=Ilumatobacter sp. TaxID=1967498 RepID=UPI003C72D358